MCVCVCVCIKDIKSFVLIIVIPFRTKFLSKLTWRKTFQTSHIFLFGI